MANALRKSYKGISVLFMLNWDNFLFFGATALAMAGCAYVISL